ncbi:MAG: glutathione S-transferase family protein [Pseudomonadota bacterium]
MKLYIGNKNYSSWSFRPWVGMKVVGVEFEEVLVPFDDDNNNAHFAEFSPTSQVPVLVDDGQTIWQSLAILDHVARKHPGAGLWPERSDFRSDAMAVSCEMLASFFALRAACPMNMRRQRAAISLSDAVLSDVARVERIWQTAINQSGGPFLYGDFSIADAMYAPVVNRLDVYDHNVSSDTRAYMSTIQSLDAWKAWEAAGKAEVWVVEADEV